MQLRLRWFWRLVLQVETTAAKSSTSKLRNYLTKISQYHFGFWYIFIVICIYKSIYLMSRELIEFSDMIEEQFDIGEIEEIEPDDFWTSVVNMFI
ncbi:hypothetical protein [Mucilaginibacter gotjawali]|nr:hypothetical protein [Mucilaginibacter gotjawali]